MHTLACPKCHLPLTKVNTSYLCPNKHCYDLSKQSYLNVLLNPDKATNDPGDSTESLEARTKFLSKGYYDSIVQTVVATLQKYSTDSMHIVDIGCGEGYYMHRIKQALGNTHTYYGLDIAKRAIKMATRYTKDVYWLVGNSKNLPLLDHSIDFALALFTVVNEKELLRIIKKDGYIIHITANPNHLVEIKKQIYDTIKVKSDANIRLDFPIIESFNLVQPVSINNHEDAYNLIKMTPHYYHIKKEKRSVLDTIDHLEVTIDCKVTVYQP